MCVRLVCVRVQLLGERVGSLDSRRTMYGLLGRFTELASTAICASFYNRQYITLCIKLLTLVPDGHK